MLSRDEERELIIAWRERGDEKAFQKLLDDNRGLIMNQSRRHINTRVGKDDLMQQAAIGVFRAAKKFDMSRDNRLSTYLNWFTRDEISTAGRKNSNVANIPQSHMTGKGKDIWKAWESELEACKLSQSDGDTQTIVTKIATDLSVTENMVRAVVQAWQSRDHSLDATLPGADGDREAPLPSALIETTTAETYYLSTEAETTTITILTTLMGELDDRERDIIQRRKFKNETLEVVSKVHGISRERVRQLENRAMGKMMARRDDFAEDAMNCLSEMR